MRRGLLYAGVFYLALCATCYACRAQSRNERTGETESVVEHQQFLRMLSCEALASVGEQAALDVLEAEREAKAARIPAVRKAWLGVRAQRLQDLTDVDEEEHMRCGLERR